MTYEQTDYFDKARSWADNETGQVRRSVRLAWIVAGSAGFVALVQAAALAMLVPLKEVEPIMLLVDRTTGFVQEIHPSETQRIRADEALIQSLLAQYVVAREGFDRATVRGAHRRAALWSTGKARSSYLAAMPVSNPASPFNIYRPGESLIVAVKSVSQLEPGQAMVRFDTIREGDDGRSVPAGSWISVIRYRFTNAAMSYEDRLINPLGLQVTSYRRDTEMPQTSPVPDTAPFASNTGVSPIYLDADIDMNTQATANRYAGEVR